MKSDSGIIYHEPPRGLWLPRPLNTGPQPLTVRFKTEICECDSRGRIVRVRPGQQGSNTITDWGMDALVTGTTFGLSAYLHLSDTLGPAKRPLTGGTTLSVAVTSPTSITVTASAGFFAAGDAGNTLSITDFGGSGQTQELQITSYTSATQVSCSTRQGAWLPGFTPGTGPFSQAAVHFTSTNTLANQFTKFNSYDGSATNYRSQLNDSANHRFISQTIFLSGAVSGTAWTVNQLGWSDGNASNNVFGKVNLASPDIIGVGLKYRVQLQIYSAYTPINLSSVVLDWGATIGSYTVNVLQERIGYDQSDSFYYDSTIYRHNFLRPAGFGSSYGTGLRNWFLTTAQSPQSVLWAGDAGFTTVIHTGMGGQTNVTDGAYTSGTHTKLRSVKWDDTIAFTAATWLGVGATSPYGSHAFLGYALSIFPVSPTTFAKPAGYWCSLDFALFWTRAFSN
jgi:hypothetical protein